MVSGESSVYVQRVPKDHVRELGKKALFKDLMHEGGDCVVQYCESVVFRAPPAVSSTRPQTVCLFGNTHRTSSTWT